MQCQIMYMDTDSSIIHIKIIEVYEHIDVEKSMKSMIWKLWNYEKNYFKLCLHGKTKKWLD